MIYEFTFSNFRSYKNEATIDFSAKPITEFENSLINVEGEPSILPVCAIYGPNGGGKSSALMALKTLKEIVINPLVQMVFMKNKNEKLASATIEELQAGIKNDEQDIAYYKWDKECENKPTVFSILFLIKGKKYRYELTIKNKNICEENLYLKEIKDGDLRAVFERDEDGIYLCEELANMDINNLNGNLPLISYISMFKDLDIVDDAIQFFMNMQTVNFDIPKQDRRVLIKVIERHKNRFINVVQSMGIDIDDIRVEYDNNGKVSEVYVKHSDVDGELEFTEESSGTRKIFSILPVILNGIDRGTLFVIDELDAKLHPALLQSIIELFTDHTINRAGAQLLFTSHDLTTMSNEVFRRDEIWFSAINGYNESVLYSLVDFKKENGEKPRKDEAYNKQYLEGRYGADPYMKQLKNWEVVS
ncbi:MAG: AAA family ATPase [Eubacteriales bacterium]|nr:AAA family ATPase [Eubacteriales bacterium]